jgi:hypothetical protein
MSPTTMKSSSERDDHHLHELGLREVASVKWMDQPCGVLLLQMRKRRRRMKTWKIKSLSGYDHQQDEPGLRKILCQIFQMTSQLVV